MNNGIQCPFCDNNIIVDKVQIKTKVKCPVCNSSFECKLFSENPNKDSRAGFFALSKTYKQLSIVIILILVGICFYFYKTHEIDAKYEQTVNNMRNFITKVHPERKFSEVELRRGIADSLGIPYYISDTDKTIDEITASVNHELETLLAKKYPEKTTIDFMVMAKNELGLIMDKPDMNREDLDSLVEHEVEKEMKNINSKTIIFDEESELKTIAAELRMKFPVEAPKRSISECEKLINEKIDQDVYEALGRARDERIKEITQKYKPYKIGDIITVNSIRSGIVTGKYNGIEGVFLKVGETKVLVADIQGYSEEPKFDRYICDKLRNEETLPVQKNTIPPEAP